VNTFPVRVKLTNVWDELHLDVDPETSLTDLKRQVLDASGVQDDPARYVVKYRGAQILESGATVGNMGVPRNAALAMLPRRREAVR
jgi:Fe-S-cluster formation regulator IscX/YfhJ